MHRRMLAIDQIIQTPSQAGEQAADERASEQAGFHHAIHRFSHSSYGRPAAADASGSLGRPSLERSLEETGSAVFNEKFPSLK